MVLRPERLTIRNEGDVRGREPGEGTCKRHFDAQVGGLNGGEWGKVNSYLLVCCGDSFYSVSGRGGTTAGKEPLACQTGYCFLIWW